MAKFSIHLHGQALFSVKEMHKKLGLYTYGRVIATCEMNMWSQRTELITFDNKLQAKLWLLYYSNIPKAASYFPVLVNDELKIDKIITKGKYCSKLYFTGFNIAKNTKPLLCEFDIVEVFE